MSRRPVRGNLPVYFPTTAPIACRRAVGTLSGALPGQWLSHGAAGETAAEDGAVLLVDTASGAVVGRARLPLDHATHLWVSPDGRELWADTERSLRVRFRIGK